MSNEIEWRDIPDYEGVYQASEHGEIICLIRKGNRRANRHLNQYVSEHGYFVTSINNKRRYVHRLVASAFLGPCPEGYQVNHKDLNKLNNHVSNLEYVTRLENVRHARANLPNWPNGFGVGENHINSKLTEETVREIRRLYKEDSKFFTQRGLARMFGVSKCVVNLVIHRKIWKQVED